MVLSHSVLVCLLKSHVFSKALFVKLYHICMYVDNDCIVLDETNIMHSNCC